MLSIGFRDDYGTLGLNDISVLPTGNPITSLENAAIAGSTITFSWNAISNSTYQIQATTNLAQTNWTTLATVTATNTLMSTNEALTNKQQFYRIVLVP